MMNLSEMMQIVDRANDFRDYLRMFYSAEHDGLWGDEYRFTEEEIVNGMNEYFQNEEYLNGILVYGADTVDRERVRDLILAAREMETT
jgi:hypothetical protein